MPILRITDPQSRNASRGIPRFGKIKKGDEKSDNRPGKDLDHFRVDFDARYQYLADSFHDLYGDEPTEFEAILIGKTFDDVFDSWNISRSETKIFHKCDSEKQVLHWDENLNKHSNAVIPCVGGNADGRYQCSGKCVMQATLSFSLPALNAIAGEFGKFTLTTHSFHDINNLSNQLALLESVVPNLMFLPVTIGRGMETITRPDKQHGRAKMDKSLLYLRLKTEQIQQYIEEQNTPQLPESAQIVESINNAPMLESGNEDSDVWTIAVKTADYLNKKAQLGVEPHEVVSMWTDAHCDPRNRAGDDKLEPIAVVLTKWYGDFETVNEVAISLYGDKKAGVVMDYALAMDGE